MLVSPLLQLLPAKGKAKGWLPGTAASVVKELSRSRTPPCSDTGVHRAVIKAQDSTHQESSKFTPDGAFLLEGNGGNITVTSPKPRCYITSEQSLQGAQ